MTERDQGEDRDYPDGSVGRYVREKWGSVPTRPARAARPYVPPVEPPSPRSAPEAESHPAEAEGADVWAYQPESPWPHRPDAPDRRPEVTETDHTQVDPDRSASVHDPFAGVEYGSATWAARGDESSEERSPEGDTPVGEPPAAPGPDAPAAVPSQAGTRTSAPAGVEPTDPGATRSGSGEAARRRRAPRGAGDPGRSRPRADDPTTRRGVEDSGAMRQAHRDSADPTSPRRGPNGVEDSSREDSAAVRRSPRGGAGYGARRDHPGADGPGAPHPDHHPREDSAALRRDPAEDPAAVRRRGTGSGEAYGARGDHPADGPGAPHVDHHPREDSSPARRDPRGDDPATGPGPRRDDPVSGPVPRRDPQAEPHGSGPFPRTPAPADDDVTTRTGHTLAHPPVSMPPTARPPSAGPFPAVPQTDGPPPGARRPAPRDAHWTDPVAVAAQEAQRARTPEPLSSARLLRNTKRPPQSGWRRMIYLLTGRMFNPGESPTDIRRRQLTARVNQPLLGCYKIAMLSLKGGVGKTTMTATLGATFASLRGDRVVAVDANPDRGTLSQKIPLETSATVRNLLRDSQRVRRYTDVRAYTSQGPSRLEVLASEQDPAVSEAFSEDDYRRTVNLLEHFYNIVLTDCGTGLMHSAMYGVLGVADQLVIVSSGSIDGARSASATMDWLDAHGHGDLVANAVVVINFVHRSRGGVDLDRVSEHFAARCRAVVRIPFDAHLEEGAEIDLDRLEPGTRMALLDLAANVADAFERVHAL